MDPKGFMPEFFALAISIGVLLQTGSPLDDTNHSYSRLSMAAAFTFALGMILLTLHFALRSTTTKPLINPTIARWIDRLGTATLAASFSTLFLALPEAFTAFTNSVMLLPWSVSWELGLILLAIAVVYKLIVDLPTSCSQQYIKVVFFALCAAISGLYTESMISMSGTIPFNSVIYQKFYMYHFGLVACTFALAVILLIVGVALPDSSNGHYVSLMFKEVFSTLTLSMGCITLLIGVSLMVCASVLKLAMVRGIGGMGDGIKIGAS